MSERRMSKDELWQAVESLTSLLCEAYERQLPADVTGPLDLARGVALAMYSVSAPTVPATPTLSGASGVGNEPGAGAENHSVKVPDVMPERFLIALPGGRA